MILPNIDKSPRCGDSGNVCVSWYFSVLAIIPSFNKSYMTITKETEANKPETVVPGIVVDQFYFLSLVVGVSSHGHYLGDQDRKRATAGETS